MKSHRYFSSHVPLIALMGGMLGSRSFHFDIAGTGAAATQPATPQPPATPDVRAEFSRLQTEANAVIAAATTANRELTAEERTANDARFSRMSVISNLENEQARFASLSLTQGTTAVVQRAQDFPGRGEFDASQGRTNPDPAADPLALTDAERVQFSREAATFARTGETGAIHRRFATITTTGNSGLLLPKSVMAPVLHGTVNPFRQAHTIYGVKPIETSNTADLDMPILDANAGGVVAENSATETENGNIGTSIKLTPKTFRSGSIWFSNQQLAANDFDMLGTVTPGLTLNKELGLESAIVSALIADAAITQGVTLAGQTAVSMTYASMVALNNALPSRFDSLKAIVLSQAAYTALQGLTDTTGRPVLLLDPQNQNVVRFNGTPVFRSDYFEAFGAAKVLGVVVSLLGFKLRDVTVQNLARYTNIPNRENQTGLNLFGYHAFGWAASAAAKLKTPA